MDGTDRYYVAGQRLDSGEWIPCFGPHTRYRACKTLETLMKMDEHSAGWQTWMGDMDDWRIQPEVAKPQEDRPKRPKTAPKVAPTAKRPARRANAGDDRVIRVRRKR